MNSTVEKAPVWIFEWDDWCSTQSQIKGELTVNRLLKCAKKAGWFVSASDKEHYRLVELPDGSYDFQTEMPLYGEPGRPYEWRSIQVIKRKGPNE